MKFAPSTLSIALALLTGVCSGAEPKGAAPQRGGEAEVDAATIPEQQHESKFELRSSVMLRGSPNEVTVTPVPRKSAIYRQVKPAAELKRRPQYKIPVGPLYPHELSIRGIPGRVLVAYVVDTTGHVTNPKIIEATDERFAKSVIEAIAKWTYIPGKEKGVPTPALLVMEFDFAVNVD